MSIFTLRVTTGQERMAADVLANKAKKMISKVGAIAVFEGLRGYLMLECDEYATAKNLSTDVKYVKGVLRSTASIDEIAKFLNPEVKPIEINKGDTVEIIAGAYKGEMAKIIRVNAPKEEIVVELTGIAMRIPIKMSMNSIRVLQKSTEGEPQ